uniref:Tail fiber protein n=1 Tax=Caulobacter phage BL57 TaxID=3348355 RepID=A0AB74UKU5_9VIRU
MTTYVYIEGQDDFAIYIASDEETIAVDPVRVDAGSSDGVPYPYPPDDGQSPIETPDPVPVTVEMNEEGPMGKTGPQGPQGLQGIPGDSVLTDPGDLILLFNNRLI